MNSKRASLLLIFVCVLAVFAIPASILMNWRLRGRWSISLTNSVDGVLAEVFHGNSPEPKYSSVLKNSSVKYNVTRVTMEQLPPEIGVTVFHDETRRPGRWILIVDTKKIDIMEYGWEIESTVEAEEVKSRKGVGTDTAE